MTEISKPDYSTGLWSSGGSIVAPSNTKIQTGWTAEVPPFQWENWAQNRQDQAIAHILQHGVPVWDAFTQYQYNVSGTKSLVMGSDGIIYRAVQVNTNQNPVTDSTHTYWTPAFLSVGDAYIKADSDARYLKSASNLSDLVSTTTARTNLGVYSTATVDSKTTVATSTQAQTQTDNTVLITPLQLANAFSGSKHSLSQSGHQIYPGGLIKQWGIAVTDSTGKATGSWPTTFSAFALDAVACVYGASSPTDSRPISIGSLTSSTYTFWANAAIAGIQINFIVVGY